MLFTSVCTALVAAAYLVAGTPVHSSSDTLSTRQSFQWHDPTCVQGLITPFNKTDLETVRGWFTNTTPDANDFIAANGWFTWELGSFRVCIYNTNPNGTKDISVNHRAHASALEQIRDTCCSPTTDQCRAGRTVEYSLDGAELAIRTSHTTTVC